MNSSKDRLCTVASRLGVAAAVAVLVATLAAAPSYAGTGTISAAGAAGAVRLLAVPAVTPAGQQMTSFDQTMITLVNQARAAAGVSQLTQASGLTQLAVWWSTQLSNGVTGFALAHNSNAWTMTATYGASNRTTWGENVAWSSSTAVSAIGIFTAYMHSPGHKANILSPNYRYIGMGTVGGSHGMFNTTEFTDAVQPGQAVVLAVPKVGAPINCNPVNCHPVNGDFIRDSGTGATFRVTGGAPIFVSSWAPFGGIQPMKFLSHAAIEAMPIYPANGTFVRSAVTNQVYRIAGGVPIYVWTWRRFGRTYPTVVIDPAAVAHAGGGGVWAHLRSPLASRA